MHHTEQIYIGETKFLAQWLKEHNIGNFDQGKHDLFNLLWGIAVYICGLSHMSKRDRMILECNCKLLVNEKCGIGHDNTLSWINDGYLIVDTYNQRCVYEKNKCFITSDTVNKQRTL